MKTIKKALKDPFETAAALAPDRSGSPSAAIEAHGPPLSAPFLGVAGRSRAAPP